MKGNFAKNLYHLQALLNKTFDSLEWNLTSPPKPHSFTSLPLQSRFKLSFASSRSFTSSPSCYAPARKGWPCKPNGEEYSPTTTAAQIAEDRLKQYENHDYPSETEGDDPAEYCFPLDSRGQCYPDDTTAKDIYVNRFNQTVVDSMSDADFVRYTEGVKLEELSQIPRGFQPPHPDVTRAFPNVNTNSQQNTNTNPSTNSQQNTNTNPSTNSQQSPEQMDSEASYWLEQAASEQKESKASSKNDSSSQPNACVKWDDNEFTIGQSGMEDGLPLHLLEINYLLDYLAFFTIAFAISPAVISAVNLSLITFISSFCFSLIIVTVLMFSPTLLAIYFEITLRNKK